MVPTYNLGKQDGSTKTQRLKKNILASGMGKIHGIAEFGSSTAGFWACMMFSEIFLS